MYRSKLANIFGTRLAEPGELLQGQDTGFLESSNGATHMTPRGAVRGMDPYETRSPRAGASPRAHLGGFSTVGPGPALHSPRSPRLTPAQMNRAMQMAQAQQRLQHSHQQDKMKRIMQSISNKNEEVPISDLLLTAELARVPLTADQKQLYFTTPYANRYASTWDTGSPRSSYGLECAPKSVKWRAFNDALKHAKLQTDRGVGSALQMYADKEAFAISEAKRRDEEAAALAKARMESSGKGVAAAHKGISDEQLRMVHKVVKARLSTQFAEIRTAFRTFDKDHSGCISAEECTDALMSLNVGVPRKWIDHLVNIADYDRDGEINYAEFARILTCDDIAAIKKEGAEEEGLVKSKVKYYKPGIKESEMRAAQAKVRDMLFERGGLTKMFRAIDEDKSGACSRQEVRQLIQNLNLETLVRPVVLEELINLMDVDGDDSIVYKEFARVVTSEDVFDMDKLVEVAVEKPKPPPGPKRKGGARRRR